MFSKAHGSKMQKSSLKPIVKLTKKVVKVQQRTGEVSTTVEELAVPSTDDFDNAQMPNRFGSILFDTQETETNDDSPLSARQTALSATGGVKFGHKERQLSQMSM